MYKENNVVIANSPRKSTIRIGFLTSILLAIVTAASMGIGITTPPRSGPFCTLETCITYPYIDAAQFVPRDYFWMYPTLLMALLFVVLMVCLHRYASPDKQVFSSIALSLAIVSAAILIINYFIQLAVMQPSFLKDEVEGLSLFSQYNPHGIFIALEDIGYLLMGVSLLFVTPVFIGQQKLGKTIRLIFIISGILTIGALILPSILYGSDLEYRYEVASLTINWLTLITGGVMLSIYFKRAGYLE
jgi:hypothetical protein